MHLALRKQNPPYDEGGESPEPSQVLKTSRLSIVIIIIPAMTSPPQKKQRDHLHKEQRNRTGAITP